MARRRRRKRAIPRLPDGFPFGDVFRRFIEEYRDCATYWYIPKAATLTEENVDRMVDVLSIIESRFLDQQWGHDAQDRLLTELIEAGVVEPTATEGTQADRTALARILKVLLETLGFLWVKEGKQIVITEAGYGLLDATIEEERRGIVEAQVMKYQYPNPSLAIPSADEFMGVLPYLFLVQLIKTVGYRLTAEEFNLFVNLAQSQDDVTRIAQYIDAWRSLAEGEKDEIRNRAKLVQMPDGRSRWNRIHLSSSYQRRFFTYPRHIEEREDAGETVVAAASKKAVDTALKDLSEIKITFFGFVEEWIAYYGDPDQRPDWFTFVSIEVERSLTKDQATKVVAEHQDKLDEEEKTEVRRREIEKGIEDFYSKNLHMIEHGLELLPNGRQYKTPVSKIDLLCRDDQGRYVVIEVKVDEAVDGVFGQVLRYMGWIHANESDGRDNVRGIILAGSFPEKARYARIGLGRDDHKEYLRFVRHRLGLEEV